MQKSPECQDSNHRVESAAPAYYAIVMTARPAAIQEDKHDCLSLYFNRYKEYIVASI